METPPKIVTRNLGVELMESSVLCGCMVEDSVQS